jgi:excisionase family DNA binding protein
VADDPTPPEWFTPRQAAQYLQVSRATLYNWIRQGILAYYELPAGRGRRFRKSDLDALLQRRGGERLGAEGTGKRS